MDRFAELLGRSCFSFLEGASHPHELVERAVELELDALALCDRNGLYGSVRMHEAARQRSLPVIVGAELDLEPEPQPLEPGPGGPAAPQARPSVALLVEDHRGYAGLCRSLTRAHANHDKGDAGISAARVAEEADGLFAVVPLDPRAPLDRAELAVLREAFGERCAIATWRHLAAGDDQRIALATATAARFALPIVASARPLLHHRRRKPLGDVLHCIRHKTTLDEAGRALDANAEAELKGVRQLRRLFADTPQWLAQSVAIAERCTFSLDELDYRFPSEYGEPRHDPDQALRRRVAAGSRDRFPDGVPAAVQAQLDKELALIAELRVAPYFLSVQEIVELARERGILCQGRGSAANSAVCFVLGITAVDPVRSSLLFERFMSSERREPPDIDVDFEHERREEVIQAIYRRYGRDRAAMVSEIIAYRPKSALREVGKVFGLSADQLERLSSVVSHYAFREDTDGRTPEQIGIVDDRSLSRRGLDPSHPRLQQVVRLAAELEGMPRHLSIHVGGFVLSAEPLTQVAPIEPARMADRTVIPWDKDDLEALGFFKVDVLGLGMLTAIRKALALVHEHDESDQSNAAAARHGGDERPVFDPIAELARIPPEDPAVYEAVCRADTVGVFQIESRAQMSMLPLLQPRCFYDLVVEVGIVRPGPIQGKMVHPYLRRRTGEEPVTYPHRCLEPILERTLGVPLFQEQVMQIAIVGAGYTGGQADQLRRDMAAWRKHGRLARHRQQLLSGFRRQGISHEFGERLFRQIMGFGEYGFPESHAASFALIVYASAWLKVHHPAAFACALINAQPMGFYSPAAIIRDAQRARPGAAGVEVRPVRVEHSEWDCTLERRRDGTLALRLGFRLLRGLRRRAAERIVAARHEPGCSASQQPGDPAPAGRRFDGIEDLIQRARLERHELELLAEAGALEGIVPERRQALWSIRAPRAAGLFGDRSVETPRAVGLPPLEPAEQLALDYGTVGWSLDDHPMRHVRRTLRGRRLRRACEQRSFRRGQQVTVAGVVQSRQRPMTAGGVVFLTLEDETGVVNLIVYPQVYEAHELVVRHASIIVAQGRVDRRGDVVHVKATRLERVDPPASRPLALRSRDFR